jgi:predicted nucleotidyltransferase
VTILEQVLERAKADPAVAGVVLTGSHARGTATPLSDHDVLIVRSDGIPTAHTIRSADLDEVVCTVDALADTSVLWQRYAYRGAQVLLDRLGGRIAELVARQATPTAAEAAEWAGAGLDAYVNQLYRSIKSRRAGDNDAARLDEVESVPWLLQTVFALHGRLRPYNKYLAWELEHFPLPQPWNDALAPGAVLGRAVSLFPAVTRLARDHGHGEVLDSWGTDVDLVLAYASEKT